METHEQIQLRPDTVVDREIVPVKPLSLHEFGEKLRRRKNLALGTFAVVTLLGLAMILATKPLYSAKTRLLITGRNATPAPTNSDSTLGSLFTPAAAREVDTQVEVLQSANLLNKTAQRVGVPVESVKVTVRQLGKTDLAELIVVSNSRQAAEKFAALLPQEYLQEMDRSRMREVSTALGFSQTLLRQKTAQLEKDEQALKNFKIQAGVVNLDAQRTEDIRAVAIAESTVRQTGAEAASASARLDSLRASRAKLSSSIASPVTVTNPEVALLKDRVASLREERARLLFLFKPNSDEVRKADVNIAALERRLAVTPAATTSVTRAPNPAIADLDAKIADTWAQYEAARVMWMTASSSTARLRNSLNRYNRIETKQDQLQRAVDQGRNSVGVLSRNVEEMSLRKKAVQAADAPMEVVGSAGPAQQIAPRFIRSLIVTLLMAGLLACGAALMRDSFDQRLKSEEEAGSFLGMPVLGRLQHANSKLSANGVGNDQLAGDSYYRLWSNVQFALMQCAERSVQITSTVPGEGATMTAVNLAVETAIGNRRAILVDANLHNPQLHRIFQLPARPGLTDVLAGRSTLDAALQESDTPNLKILTAGTLDRHDSVLLGSSAMNELLLKLNAMADFVVLDSPPVSIAADAQMLASKVDGVVCVMKLRGVERSAALQSLKSLQQAGANLLGLALNNAESTEDLTYSNYVQQNDDTTGGFGGAAAGSTPDQTVFDDRFATTPAAPRARRSTPPRQQSLGQRESSPLKKWLILAAGVLVAAGVYQGVRSGNTAPVSGSSETTLRVADAVGQSQQWVANENGSGQWQPLKTGSSLATLTGVRTGQNATLLLQLGEAGVLRVGPDTRLKLRRLSADQYSVQLQAGKIWALVKQNPTEARLEVRAPAAHVLSESGLFSVASGLNGKLAMISVVKGEAKIQRENGAIELNKGQALRVVQGRPLPARATPLPATTRAMWHWLHDNEKWLKPNGTIQLGGTDKP